MWASSAALISVFRPLRPYELMLCEQRYGALGLMHFVMCLFIPQLLLVLTAYTMDGEMAKLS